MNAVRSGVNDFRAGDTKPTAPDALNISLYPKSSNAADPTVGDTLWYFQDSAGNEGSLVGIPDGYVFSATVTLVAGAYSVSFPTPIADISTPGSGYRIGLTPGADEAVHYESKTAAGFSVVSSNGASTAPVDVIVTRTRSPT